MASNARRRHRYATDPVYRERIRARNRAYWADWLGPKRNATKRKQRKERSV